MKIPLLYGSLIALIGALLTFGLYFAGYHDSPEKMESSQWTGSVVGIAATIVCLVLAMKERRAQAPVDADWTYGSAFGTGVLTVLWASVLGAVFMYVYLAFVNPQFGDVAFEVQVAKAEARGASASQIEAMEQTKRFLGPPLLTLFQAIGGFIGGFILSLIVAIFFRKRELPHAPDSAIPPPVGSS